MNYLTLILPTALLAAGTALQRRDKDSKGADDAFGRVLIQIAPGVTAALDGNDRALLKALKASREGLDMAIMELEKAGK